MARKKEETDWVSGPNGGIALEVVRLNCTALNGNMHNDSKRKDLELFLEPFAHVRITFCGGKKTVYEEVPITSVQSFRRKRSG